MVIAASTTIVKRSELKQKNFFLPVIIGVISGVMLNIVVLGILVVGWESFLTARYIIPISGMIIGNCLTNAIIGMRTFYQSLVKDDEQYKYYLMSGATKNEALFRFFSLALKNAFAPTIASIATIGLIWLPGMMTGQILGGSSPLTAIKYQIIMMIAVLSSSVITLYISLTISKRFVFDKYDRFDRTVCEIPTKNKWNWFSKSK
jgi:putative ABC transport system permease protein